MIHCVDLKRLIVIFFILHSLNMRGNGCGKGNSQSGRLQGLRALRDSMPQKNHRAVQDDN
jgi:hypothetical protein